MLRLKINHESTLQLISLRVGKIKHQGVISIISNSIFGVTYLVDFQVMKDGQ